MTSDAYRMTFDLDLVTPDPKFVTFGPGGMTLDHDKVTLGPK